MKTFKRIAFTVSLIQFSLYAYCFKSVDCNCEKIESDWIHITKTGIYGNNYDSAYNNLFRIIRLSEAAECWDIYLKAQSMLIFISDQFYRFQPQKEAAENGLRILRLKTGFLDSADRDFEIRADMYTMIGLYYRNSGDFDNAIEIYNALITLLHQKKAGNSKSLFNVYAYIADIYMKMGLYEKVFEYYILAGESLPEKEDEKLYYSYMHTLYIGSYFFRMNDFNKAKSYYISALGKSIALKGKENFKRYLVSNYDILALIFQKLNLRDSAIICLEKSIKLQSPHDPKIIDTYEYYGDCLFNFKEFKEAIEYYHKAYILLSQEEIHHSYRKFQIVSKVGNSFQGLSNYKEAIHYYQQAFSLLYKDSSFLDDPGKNPKLNAIQADKVMIRLLISKANALSELAEISTNKRVLLLQSISSYHLASHVIDEFRHKISTDDFKEFFVTNAREMYNNAIKTSFTAYQLLGNDSIIELAFYFMEKSKNQVLIDAIKEVQARKIVGVRDPLIATENNYRNKIVELENRLYKLKFSDADAKLISNCQYESAKTQHDYEMFLGQIEAKYPNYYNLKYRNDIPTIKETQKLIKNSVLIEYMVGNDFISLIAFNKKKSVFILFPIDSLFNNKLNNLLQQLTDVELVEISYNIATFKNFINDAIWMYSMILKPTVEAFKGYNHLIIIPDDKLCYLPFETLIRKSPENIQEVDFRNINYVLYDFMIHYEFSTELFLKYQSPSFNQKREKIYLGFAPTYPVEKFRNIRVLGKNTSEFLSPLKYNHNEIKGAASIFRGNTLLGEQANEKAFKENLFSYKIIHIAGHALINDSIPELSGIFFSSVPDTDFEKPGIEDNVTYINELCNMNLNCSLAILSACETGKGRLLRGEGLISIGRAFAFAGCPSLIMSLWKINDRSTSVIIKNFSQYLKNGKRKDTALRNAKIEYLQHADYYRTHPFYWSALIPIGNNERLFSIHRRIMILATSCFLIMALMLIWYKKNNKRTFKSRL